MGGRPVRLDIVGCGTVVSQVHAPVINVLRQQEGLTVAGCYDPNIELAEAVASVVGAERWGAGPEPADGDGVGGALVATPPTFHAEIADRYIRAGKSVLVEKPFSRNGEEAEQLVSSARDRGVLVAVNQLLRYYPTIVAARRFLADELDRIDSIEASSGSRWEWSPASNYVVEDPYGGVIHDTGAHVVDTVLFILGLDASPDRTSFGIDEIAKTPQAEPSHECRARIVLSSAGRDTPVGLALSRLRPLLGGIRVFGAFGTLFVPSFTPGPILFRNGEAVRIRGAEPEDEATDVLGCQLLTYRDFLRQARDPSDRTRIDGDRFLLQMRILESLRGREG